ncbi:hypothetical protein FA95DRAFT_1490047 [Auriscalpium vulgare]|uniref:Uncharacterized protein n=1 Tax=Auriscalpium vulgare TaxID=40419 RepID=A0ACB8RYF0_9AGAM|nr:hypothetical protein FA95DRAFT_1490047 [Auriscalpium vulgare]
MVSSPTIHSNSSAYTLATVHFRDDDESSSLLSDESASHSYGTAPHGTNPPNARRVIFNAALKMAVIFLVSSIVLGGTLWLALPPLDPEDRPLLRIPKSFAALQDLNYLLKKYRDIYPFRVVVCYVITYLFLQAFSLPGSMYLSILGGAVWGVPRALPLACACVATGGTLCYLLSAALGPALLTLPSFQRRLETWSAKVSSQRANIIPFLIVLRIAPLPPHWVVNVICPHVGIGLVPFWTSTFLGIFGVTVIHTTIGGGLDSMTSAADFHLISWRNFFMLSAVVMGAMIPVGIRYVFKREAEEAAGVEEAEVQLAGEDDAILESGPPAASPNKTKGGPQLVLIDDVDEGYVDTDDEYDEDVILEAGPALVLKPEDEVPTSPRLRRLSISPSSSTSR